MHEDKSGEAMAYVARHDCGKLIMAAVDKLEYKDDVAKEIAACIKKGYTIERMTCAEVRKSDWCECKRTKKTPKATQLELTPAASDASHR